MSMFLCTVSPLIFLFWLFPLSLFHVHDKKTPGHFRVSPVSLQIIYLFQQSFLDSVSVAQRGNVLDFFPHFIPLHERHILSLYKFLECFINYLFLYFFFRIALFCIISKIYYNKNMVLYRVGKLTTWVKEWTLNAGYSASEKMKQLNVI